MILPRSPAPANIQPVFSERLRDAVDVLTELKRRGISEQAAATLMVYFAIDRVVDRLAEIEEAVSVTGGRE